MTTKIGLISELLLKLYRGPLDQSPWSEFLEALRVSIPSSSSSLTLRIENSVRPAYLMATGDHAAHKKYGHLLYVDMPLDHLPDGKVIALTELITPAEYEASDYYRLFLEPYNIHHIIGADLKMQSKVVAQIRLVRPKADGEYSAAERDLLKELLEHVRQAVELFIQLDRLSSMRETFLSAADLFPIGIMMLDQNGKVLESNAVADAILAERDGFAIKHGVLAATRPNSILALKAAIAEVVQRKKSSLNLATALSVERAVGRPNLNVMLRPAPKTDELVEESASAVICIVSDPLHEPILSAAAIGSLFNFTPSEAALAVLLVGGSTTDEAAEMLNISLNTIRTHLYSMFRKAGVNRQAQLVASILRSSAGWMAKQSK